MTICSSFTAEPLEPMLKLLFKRTGVDSAVRFSPYSQVLQELLAANSTLRSADSVANVLLLRASDYLQGNVADDGAVEKSANEIAAAVREYDAHTTVAVDAGCDEGQKRSGEFAIRKSAL